MKAFFRTFFVDLPLVVFFVLGFCLGYFRNPHPISYDEDADD